MIKIFLLAVILLILIGALFISTAENNENLISVKLPEILNNGKPIETPELTIESIFSQNYNIEHFPQKDLVTILATGDIIPARSVNFQATQRNNFLWPYEKVEDVLKDSDLTFVNLEAPLIKNCPLTNEGMIFCGDERNIEGLKFADIDIVSLANNHAGNYGEKGVKDIIKLLESSGIDVTGTASKNLLIKEIKETKFAFLGFNDITKPQPGVSNLDEETTKKEIENAEKQADVVIVAIQWGVEYRSQPDERQIELAHMIIDAGGDLIIGNHPHWIQPVEIYKDKLITYAHGNFIFDQEWSQKTKEGIVGKYVFYKDKLVGAEFLPLEIIDYGQPYFLEGVEKNKILKNLESESYQLKEYLN